MSDSPSATSRHSAALAEYQRLNDPQNQGERATLDFPSRGLLVNRVRRLPLRQSYHHQRTRLAIKGELFDLVVAPARMTSGPGVRDAPPRRASTML